MARLYLQPPFEMLLRQTGLTQAVIYQGDDIVRLGIVRLQFEGTPRLLQRRIELPLLHITHRQPDIDFADTSVLFLPHLAGVIFQIRIPTHAALLASGKGDGQCRDQQQRSNTTVQCSVPPGLICFSSRRLRSFTRPTN